MELLGIYKISFDTLRSAAIQCYALDTAAYPLLLDSTHACKTGKTQSIYEELFTEQLLAFAIALRTKFYQGLDYKNTASYISAAGLLYKYKNNTEETITFSVKDICDKIIHANKISRTLEPGISLPTTTFHGCDIDKSKWELSISVTLFMEGVLSWLQDIENLAETGL